MVATTALTAVQSLWRSQGLDQSLLALIDLPSAPPLLPSSFQVATAAQASIGAAALASAGVYSLRTGQQQRVTVSSPAAERECTGLFKLDGETPNPWEKFSGLYPTRDGHVRLHANFAHHRDGALQILGFSAAEKVEKADVAAALLEWSAQEFEDRAAAAGLVASRVRTFAEWDAHPHAIAITGQPLVKITKIDAADIDVDIEADITIQRTLNPQARPLSGIRVLDLTRILAGPVCGRTLAAYGADVMLVNAPHLPNISSIIETSRGKRSAHLDLADKNDQQTMLNLVTDAHIFVQGYRPGGLDDLGFSPQTLAAHRPGIIYVSLSAYGSSGPWAGRRGFDSLVQTATGFNHAEALAFKAEAPKPMPVQILDYASGFLMAFGAQAALLKQAALGGSWQVEVSLLQTANWLRSMGQDFNHLDARPKKLNSYLQPYPCEIGELLAMPHAADFEITQPCWEQPAAMPGSAKAQW